MEEEGAGPRGDNAQRGEAKMWVIVVERVGRQALWQLVSEPAGLAVGWPPGQRMPVARACLGLHDVLQAVPPAGGPGEAARHLQGGWQKGAQGLGFESG